MPAKLAGASNTAARRALARIDADIGVWSLVPRQRLGARCANAIRTPPIQGRQVIMRSARSARRRSARANRDTKFGWARARVRALFGGGGTDHVVGHGRVSAVAFAGLEGFFHAAVFAGVEREQRGAAAGAQAVRELAQECIERAELVVDFDAQGLEYAAHAEVGVAFAHAGPERVAHGVGELSSRLERAAASLQRASDALGVRLVGIVGQRGDELRVRRAFEP